MAEGLNLGLEALPEIQAKLKVPKGQLNSFGGYKYRSCEDILEAVKPLLHKHALTLTVTDNLVTVGDRYYVKAKAVLRSGDSALHTEGYAREEEAKKGMDGSQITGAASSYARKYALNGLFLIDDTKDADATNIKDQPILMDTQQKGRMNALLTEYGITDQGKQGFLKETYGDPSEFTKERATAVIRDLESKVLAFAAQKEVPDAAN